MPERTERILVVDDEPAVRTVLRWALDAAGYSLVTVVSNLREAAEEVRGQPPDLIVLDVVLHTSEDRDVTVSEFEAAVRQAPEHNTFAFLQWLRRLRGQETPVILHTARMFMTDLRPLLQDGRTFYLRKWNASHQMAREVASYVTKALDPELDEDVWEIDDRRR